MRRYLRLIEARLAELGLADTVDAYHVMAWMRNERPTLDALTLEDFFILVDLAIGIAMDAPAGMSEQLAAALGIQEAA